MNDGAALGLVLDQVSKDKNIDRAVLVETLEQAILTAAKRAFGMNREMEAKFNEETGRVDLFQSSSSSTDDARQRGREIALERRATARPRGRARRRAAVPDFLSTPRTRRRPRSRTRSSASSSKLEPRLEGLRPHRRADRQAGHPPARPRGRARERLQRVQGPQGRAHHRHRPPLRARQHHRRPRPRRGRAAGARAGAARDVPRRRPHRGVRPRHRSRGARAADHPVAHAQGPAREAVRAGGPGDLREASCASRRPPASRARARRSPSARATATSIRSARASA